MFHLSWGSWYIQLLYFCLSFISFIYPYLHVPWSNISYISIRQPARYHRDLYGHPNQKNWMKAGDYYRQSLQLIPDSGNPHNQLAVLATYTDDDFEAIYHYFRSLAVSNPFVTAKDNLVVLVCFSLRWSLISSLSFVYSIPFHLPISSPSFLVWEEQRESGCIWSWWEEPSRW